jgi:alkylhydroperoxidase family enzyme
MDDALTRHAGLVESVRRAVFEEPAHSDPAVRRAAGDGEQLPEPWGDYAATVRDRSYRISDDDVAALKTAGCTEDEIFEITVAAAMGAALHRLDVGLAALRGHRP